MTVCESACLVIIQKVVWFDVECMLGGLQLEVLWASDDPLWSRSFDWLAP
jgi:hypothetical protein